MVRMPGQATEGGGPTRAKSFLAICLTTRWEETPRAYVLACRPSRSNWALLRYRSRLHAYARALELKACQQAFQGFIPVHKRFPKWVSPAADNPLRMPYAGFALQIVVVMYSFAVALRFHYAPLFHATAVVSTIPGYERVRQMSAGQTVRLIASYAAVRHYEPILMYKAVSSGQL